MPAATAANGTAATAALASAAELKTATVLMETMAAHAAKVRMEGGRV